MSTASSVDGSEVKVFRTAVLKVGADGSSLPRSIFVTGTRLCVALPSGGVTRTILIERIETLSLNLAPAAASSDAGAGGVDVAFRVANEPALMLRLPSEEDALTLVSALKASPYCDAVFRTPHWTYVSPTRGGSEKTEDGDAAARGPSTASTREGHQNGGASSSSGGAPSPPSSLSTTSTATPGPAADAAADDNDDNADDADSPSPPPPARALAGESSFTVQAPEDVQPSILQQEAEGEGAGSSLLPAHPTRPAPARYVPSPLEDIIQNTSQRRASVGSTPDGDGDGERAAGARRPPQPPRRHSAEWLDIPAAAPLTGKPVADGSGSIHAWTPPRMPSYWRDHSRSDDDGVTAGAIRVLSDVSRPRAESNPARGEVARLTDFAPPPPPPGHAPRDTTPTARPVEASSSSSWAAADAAAADDLRRSLRVQEDLLRQLAAAQEEARTAKAAQAAAEADAARYRAAVDAAHAQLDAVSRSFTQAMQSREGELQQQHRAELATIQDAFDAYDRRMSSFVDQLQRDHEERRQQWREERQVLQGLLEKQHTHIDSLLLTTSPRRRQQQQQQQQRRSNGSPRPRPSPPRPSTYDRTFSAADGHRHSDARLVKYAAARQQQQQQQLGGGEGLRKGGEGGRGAGPAASSPLLVRPSSSAWHRAIRTPSPKK